MKFYVLLLFGIFITFSGYSQPCKKLYKDQLEPSSRLVKCGGNFTVERLKNGLHLYKRYYPENKTITLLATYKTRRLNELHGLYEERWDDGTLVMSGMYENNRKVGIWIDEDSQVGLYKNGKREGEWKSYGKDSIIYGIFNYSKGELHGEQIRLDSLGIVILLELYEHGKLISTSLDSSEHIHQEMPRFPGCEHLDLALEALQHCSSLELLGYLFSKIEYPDIARRQNIEGKALIRFVIDEEGNISDITMLSGISKEISVMLISVVKSMPKWRPGMQNGTPVKATYNLPIVLRLK